MQGYFSAEAVSRHCNAVSERKADVMGRPDTLHEMLHHRVSWGHKGGSSPYPRCLHVADVG